MQEWANQLCVSSGLKSTFKCATVGSGVADFRLATHLSAAPFVHTRASYAIAVVVQC